MKDEKQKTNSIGNTSPKDSSSKLIFDNHILCAQFLRDYVDVELLKDVQPEDIEDISERFLWLWQESRESDSVKKIHLKGKEGADTLFVITLIEHQSLSLIHIFPLQPVCGNRLYGGRLGWTEAGIS